VQHNAGEREAAALEAQKIVEQEACGFRRKLLAERVVPTIVACARVSMNFAGKNWSPSKKSAGRSPKMKLFY